MFLTKRRSFVIIEIESMELVNIKKERIEKAIQIINNNQTKVEYALILYYNIFKQFLHYFYNFTYIKICINDICYKKFELKTIDFIHNKHIFSFKKSLNLFVYDNCISIDDFNNFNIPYEYITTFRAFNDIIRIQILGTIDNVDNNVKIKLSGGIINVYCRCNNANDLSNQIKKNMYYHIKYNKINDEVVSYYINNDRKVKKQEKQFEENFEEKLEEGKNLEELKQELEERIINNEN